MSWQDEARASALLSSAEADLLGADPEVHGWLTRLTDELRGLEVAGQHYLAVRLRLLGPDAYGYEPADLDGAATDLRFARGVVHDTVRQLAAVLDRHEELDR